MHGLGKQGRAIATDQIGAPATNETNGFGRSSFVVEQTPAEFVGFRNYCQTHLLELHGLTLYSEYDFVQGKLTNPSRKDDASVSHGKPLRRQEMMRIRERIWRSAAYTYTARTVGKFP